MITVVGVPEVDRPRIREIGEAKISEKIQEDRLKQEEQKRKEAPRFHLS